MKAPFNVILFCLVATSLIQFTFCDDTCPYVTAPDGSFYDLSGIANRIHQVTQQTYGQTYTFIISICAPIPSGCAGACTAPNTAGVCEIWGPAPVNAKCLGTYNTARFIGLNNRAGVQIIYQGGDVCGSCSPVASRSSIITLTCGSTDPSIIPWTSVVMDAPQMPAIDYFNGTFNCDATSSPSFDPNKHVTIQYYGYGAGCNGTDAYMITVNRTRTCNPGCKKLAHEYIYTECDIGVRLPRDNTWINQIYYSDSACDTAESAIYTKSHQCTGVFEFSYQECDATTIYTYSCNSPYCNNCQLITKTPTDTCSNGIKYQCASDKSNIYSNLFV